MEWGRRIITGACCLQMYLEAVLDGFNAVRSRPHLSRTPMFRVCSEALVPFLACHFRESCIASPDMREMLLQTISILLQSKSFVARFEASSEARAHLVRLSLPLQTWLGFCASCILMSPFNPTWTSLCLCWQISGSCRMVWTAPRLPQRHPTNP